MLITTSPLTLFNKTPMITFVSSNLAMASNASFQATTVVLTLLLSLSISPKPTSAITCTKFMLNLSSCIAYAAGITQSPEPECCEALDRWIATVKTEKERRRGCLCFKEILYMQHISGDRLASIPKQCNVNLGYPISKSTRCSKSIHETYGINLSCPSTQSQHSPIFGLNDIRLSTPTIDDEGYETMSSGSSDDVEEDVDELVNDENVNINGVKDNINEFIREYCVRTDNTEEQMTVNNEYAEFPKSTRQWNAEVPSESRSIHSLTNDEYVIPNELVEHMCFRRKSELKFAIQGWSIINNVQFVVVASNRQKFTIECIQHDNLTAKCHWRLHASLSKRLGGVWKIATIKGQHTCTNPILQAGHRQCNSQFISFFIIPTIRKQMDIKPREIIGRVEAKFNIKVSRSDLCIISDRHAGLVRGCREIFPSAAHRHCLRHLRENFKKAVRQMGILDVEFVCQKMYTAGNTDDPDLFNQMMVDIIKIKPEIHQWLVERDLSKWTLIFDGGFRYGVMTTNASEAFNGILKRARGLPVQALITAIYYNIVRMFIRRLEMIIAEEHQSNNFFSARVQVKIRKLESDARRIPEPTRVNLHEFQVFDMSSRSYRVDITPDEFHTIPDKQFWPIHDPVVGLYPLTPPNFRRRSVNMAENLPPRRKRRSKQGVPQADVSQDPPPVDVHPSIATLRGSHRAAHPDEIWCWERLHVGRPTLHVPQQVSLDGLSVGYRWNQQFIRQLPAGSLSSYRDELDGLLDSQVTWEPYTTEIMSQVPDICLSGRFIWLARVPLVSWTRVEWHLPDRVLRQFGFVPTIDVHPMEPKFVRVDGRGKSDTDWLVYYLHYIGLWEDRTSHITEGTPLGDDTKHLIQHYLQWFRSWATLYMLRPTSTPPTTYYPRAVQSLLSSNDFSDAENEVHTGYTEDVQAGFTESISTPVFVDPYSMGAGPSSFQDSGPGHDYFSYPTQQHSPARVEDDILPVTVQVEQHLLRDRPVRPPQHYTPGSDALPHRGRRRR
ncbi:hypothetical protein M5K25_015319 [Dendrobium thyrsiflorum]|uniref:Non-specific lipid-transfer protein n=1 Tax=Dendrobium thyrsiflorum TaxID=117978 RepID=A0ABD0UPZ1_DENTH